MLRETTSYAQWLCTKVMYSAPFPSAVISLRVYETSRPVGYFLSRGEIAQYKAAPTMNTSWLRLYERLCNFEKQTEARYPPQSWKVSSYFDSARVSFATKDWNWPWRTNSVRSTAKSGAKGPQTGTHSLIPCSPMQLDSMMHSMMNCMMNWRNTLEDSPGAVLAEHSCHVCCRAWACLSDQNCPFPKAAGFGRSSFWRRIVAWRSFSDVSVISSVYRSEPDLSHAQRWKYR